MNELVPYEIIPSYETSVVANMVDELELRDVAIIKQLVNRNHGNVLTKIVKHNLNNIDWNWLQKRYNLNE